MPMVAAIMASMVQTLYFITAAFAMFIFDIPFLASCPFVRFSGRFSPGAQMHSRRVHFLETERLSERKAFPAF